MSPNLRRIQRASPPRLDRWVAALGSDAVCLLGKILTTLTMAANRPDDVSDGGGYRHSDQQRRHTDKYRDNKHPDRDFSHICEQPFVEELMPEPQHRSDRCEDDRKSMLGREGFKEQETLSTRQRARGAGPRTLQTSRLWPR